MSHPPSRSAEQPPQPLPQQPAGEAETPDAANDPWWFPPAGADPAIRASTPPEILEAQDTFHRDLPQLLKERPGQWVAYYGNKRIGFGKTSTALCQELERQGYKEFLIRKIYPYPPYDIISAV